MMLLSLRVIRSQTNHKETASHLNERAGVRNERN